jgi:hypothetical protein
MADRMIEYARGDLNFAAWLHEVDKIVSKKLGIGLFDLPDMMTRDAYDAESTPEEFVSETVAEVVTEDFGEEAASLLRDG